MNEFIFFLLSGLFVTLKVSICAVLVGMLATILFTLIDLSSFKTLRSVVSTFTALIRGLPEILILFTIYFAGSALLTHLFHRSVQVSAFIAGVIALASIFSSYASQTLRGAFLAIPKGQSEAAKALGLSHWIIFKNILLPQAWVRALPGLGNLWLVLLKDSALVALIGLNELMNQAHLAASATLQPFKFYAIAAVIFLMLTTFSQTLLNYWIKKTDYRQ